MFRFGIGKKHNDDDHHDEKNTNDDGQEQHQQQQPSSPPRRTRLLGGSPRASPRSSPRASPLGSPKRSPSSRSSKAGGPAAPSPPPHLGLPLDAVSGPSPSSPSRPRLGKKSSSKKKKKMDAEMMERAEKAAAMARAIMEQEEQQADVEQEKDQQQQQQQQQPRDNIGGGVSPTVADTATKSMRHGGGGDDHKIGAGTKAAASLLPDNDDGDDVDHEYVVVDEPTKVHIAPPPVNPAIQRLYDEGTITRGEYEHMVKADRLAAAQDLYDDNNDLDDGAAVVFSVAAAAAHQHDNADRSIANAAAEASAVASPSKELDLSELTATSEASKEQSPTRAKKNQHDQEGSDNDGAAALTPIVGPPKMSEISNNKDNEEEKAGNNGDDIVNSPITPAASVSMAPPPTLSKAPPGTLSKARRGGSVSKAERRGSGDMLLVGFGGVGDNSSSSLDSSRSMKSEGEADGDDLLVGFGMRRTDSQSTSVFSDNDASATMEGARGQRTSPLDGGVRDFHQTQGGGDEAEATSHSDGRTTGNREGNAAKTNEVLSTSFDDKDGSLLSSAETIGSADVDVSSRQSTSSPKAGKEEDSFLEMLENALHDGSNAVAISGTSADAAGVAMAPSKPPAEPTASSEKDDSFVQKMEAEWQQTSQRQEGLSEPEDQGGDANSTEKIHGAAAQLSPVFSSTINPPALSDVADDSKLGGISPSQSPVIISSPVQPHLNGGSSSPNESPITTSSPSQSLSKSVSPMISVVASSTQIHSPVNDSAPSPDGSTKGDAALTTNDIPSSPILSPVDFTSDPCNLPTTPPLAAGDVMIHSAREETRDGDMTVPLAVDNKVGGVSRSNAVDESVGTDSDEGIVADSAKPLVGPDSAECNVGINEDGASASENLVAIMEPNDSSVVSEPAVLDGDASGVCSVDKRIETKEEPPVSQKSEPSHTDNKQEEMVDQASATALDAGSTQEEEGGVEAEQNEEASVGPFETGAMKDQGTEVEDEEASVAPLDTEATQEHIASAAALDAGATQEDAAALEAGATQEEDGDAEAEQDEVTSVAALDTGTTKEEDQPSAAALDTEPTQTEEEEGAGVTQEEASVAPLDAGTTQEQDASAALLDARATLEAEEGDAEAKQDEAGSAVASLDTEAMKEEGQAFGSALVSDGVATSRETTTNAVSDSSCNVNAALPIAPSDDREVIDMALVPSKPDLVSDEAKTTTDMYKVDATMDVEEEKLHACNDVVLSKDENALESNLETDEEQPSDSKALNVPAESEGAAIDTLSGRADVAAEASITDVCPNKPTMIVESSKLVSERDVSDVNGESGTADALDILKGRIQETSSLAKEVADTFLSDVGSTAGSVSEVLKADGPEILASISKAGATTTEAVYQAVDVAKASVIPDQDVTEEYDGAGSEVLRSARNVLTNIPKLSNSLNNAMRNDGKTAKTADLVGPVHSIVSNVPQDVQSQNHNTPGDVLVMLSDRLAVASRGHPVEGPSAIELEKDSSPQTPVREAKRNQPSPIVFKPTPLAFSCADDDNHELRTDDVEGSRSGGQGRKPALDPRAAMLAAIQARKSDDDGKDEEAAEKAPKPKAKPAVALDPRAAMMAAIQARKSDADDDGGDEEAAEKAPKPKAKPAVALDPRAAMMAAIQARKSDADDDGGDEEAAEKAPKPKAKPAVALDPRAAMMAAIQARKSDADDDGGDEEAAEKAPKPKAKPAVALDPRAAMMAAIQARKSDADDDGGDEEAAEKAPKPKAKPAVALDPRAAMMAAIQARKSDDDDDGRDEETGEEAPKPKAKPAVALDPRAAMMAAIQARRSDADDSEGNVTKAETKEVLEEAPKAETRSAMLAAIASRNQDNVEEVRATERKQVVPEVDSKRPEQVNDEGRAIPEDVSMASSLGMSYFHDYGLVTHISMLRGKDIKASYEDPGSANLPYPVRFMASVLFHQMIARCKHADIAHFITDRPLSVHDVQGKEDLHYVGAEVPDDNTTSSVLSNLIEEGRQCDVMFPTDSSIGHRSKLPRSEVLSSFLTELGGLPSCDSNTLPSHSWETGPRIRNEIPGSVRANSDAKLLLKVAKSNLKIFEKQIERIVAFASRQDEAQPTPYSPSVFSSPLPPPKSSRVSYSVGIKSEASVIDKAERKYGGDVLRVKDALRAQIILPNECTLVCALLSLQHICSDRARISSTKRMKIIRIKNLFRLSPLGTIVPTDLPTGYRHVLINVRLRDGLVAELQFQLEKMYNVIGEDGYRLHRHIIEVNKAARRDRLHTSTSMSTEARKQRGKSKNDKVNPLLLCRCAENIGVSDSSAMIDTIAECLIIRKSNPQDEPASQSTSYRPYSGKYVDKDEERNNGILRSHLAIPDGKFSFLSELYSDLNRLTSLDLVNVAISSGLSYLNLNAGDVSAYICLHNIFLVKLSLTGLEADRAQAEMLLMQGLSSVDHSATGYSTCLHQTMTPSMDSSMDVLAALAAFHCALNDWESATSALQSLVLRCEEHLPLYHPMALTSTIDLAASYLNCGQEDRALRCIERARQRLAIYLREQEEAYFLSRRESSLNRRYENNLDHLTMIKAYVATLHRMKRRKMARILGPSHPMSLLFHCCLGDTLSVLANCVGLSQHSDLSLCVCCGTASEGKLVSVAKRSSFVWEIAAIHYKTALRGWISSSGAFNANVSSTVSSLARCLRELGRREEALKVLSLAVKSVKQHVAPLWGEGKERGKVSNDGATTEPRRTVWVPPGTHADYGKEELLAMLMWLIAVYAIEEDDGEKGRTRAISLLRAIPNIVRQETRKGQISLAKTRLRAMAQRELKNVTAIAPYLDEERPNPSDQRTTMLSAMREGDEDEPANEPDVVDEVSSILPQAAMLEAIKSRQVPSGEDGAGIADARPAMLSAIKSRQPPSSDEDEGVKPSKAKPMDPRSAMLNAIKARQPASSDESAAETSDAKSMDPRSAMLSAIKARQPASSDESAAEPSEAKPMDPRSAMLSAIKARQPASSDEGGDPRSAMLSAIKSREPASEEDEGSKPSEAKPMDPRSAMLSAIKSRQQSSSNESAAKPSEAKPMDPRSAMLSAIKSRQPASSDESAAEPSEAKPMDPRSAMLSAIKARQPASRDEGGDLRTAMLSAIKSRQPASSDEGGDTKPSEAKPVDARSAMLSAIKARKVDGSGEGGINETYDTGAKKVTKLKEVEPKPAVVADPRAATLAAIQARKSDNDGIKEPNKAAEEAPKQQAKPATAPVDPRGAMLTAIQARKSDNDDGRASKPQAKPAAAAVDPRGEMLAAIQARKSDDDGEGLEEPSKAVEEAPKLQAKPAASAIDHGEGLEEPSKAVEEAPKPQAKPAVALDPRAAMMAAIQARKSDEPKEVAEEKEVEAPKPTVDARSAMLAAISARKTDDEVDEGIIPEKTANDISKPAPDARSALLASIKARKGKV